MAAFDFLVVIRTTKWKNLVAIQLDFGISEKQIVAAATNNGSNFIEILKEFGVKDTNVNTIKLKSWRKIVGGYPSSTTTISDIYKHC